MRASNCSGPVEALMLYFPTPSIVNLFTEGKLGSIVVHKDPLLNGFPCFSISSLSILQFLSFQ
jgi:hypothetical protein